jgi:hypothetical protein
MCRDSFTLQTSNWKILSSYIPCHRHTTIELDENTKENSPVPNKQRNTIEIVMLTKKVMDMIRSVLDINNDQTGGTA